MKIVIVSSQSGHAQAVQAHLASEGKRHSVSCLTAGAASLSDAFSSAPDLVIVAADGDMKDVLTQLDSLTAAHPRVQLMIASQEQSPEFLRLAMRAGAREVLPLSVTKAALEDAIASIERKAAAAAHTSRENGKVFAFIGCKGGAGTTFLATNWAHIFAAERSRRVAFIDLNRQFGDALFYLSDEVPPMDVADLAREAQRLDGSLLTGSMVCVAPNLHLLAAAESPEKAQTIGVQEVSLILKHAAREYDAVVVDIGNVVDEVSALVLDVADRVYPVMQATVPCLRAASRLFKVLQAYPREKTEWIINRYEEQGDVSLADIERALDKANLRTIAGNFRTVCAAIAQGVALSQLDKNGRVIRDLRNWASTIFPAEVTSDKTPWLKRWVTRPSHEQPAVAKA